MILPEHSANKLLSEASIPVIPLIVIDSHEEARMQAHRLGLPVALKFSSAKFPHKSEIGGVYVNLANDEDIEAAFSKLHNLRSRLDGEGVIIMEPMAPTGAELFIGYQLHAQFGPVMSIGLGGIFLELTEDVAFRLLPAKECDFREMLAELHSWPKLRAGFRNLPPADEGNVLDLMRRVTDFVLSRPDIRELDLNPVVMRSDGPCIVDAMIVVDEGCELNRNSKDPPQRRRGRGENP
jgi:succinyl-CoA synthetase beta subunit